MSSDEGEGGASRVAIGLIVLGAAARVLLLVELWRTSLDPDGREYLSLARGYSFLGPWAASHREPLWMAVVKATTGPVGYRPQALRVVGVILGIVGLVGAWVLLKHVAPRPVALIALGIVALDPQLVYDAVRGLREPLTLLMMLPVAALLLGPPEAAPGLNRLRRLAPVSLATLLLIRWELGLLAVVLALAAVARRTLSWQRLALGVGVAAVAVLPWLVANQHRYGDALYHSNRSAVYMRNLDIVYRHAPGPTPTGPFEGPRITWAGYYLHFVGPRQAVRRVVTGTVENVAVLLSGHPNPPWPGWPAGGVGRRVTDLGVAVTTLGGVFAVVGVAFAPLPDRRSVRTAAAIVVLAAAAYGGVSRWAEYRLMSWTLPLLALVVASGVVALPPVLARAHHRAERPPASSKS